ncbi:MAG: oligosaccharide flippase family protein [Firmicutes bacterium]|nr:oligosaccharide flippase family protein [Bacillota bacterium]
MMRASMSFSKMLGISTILSVLTGGVNFFILVRLARVLGPSSYGMFSYTWTVTGIFAVFVSWGIPSWLMREWARRDPSERADLIAHGMQATLRIGTVMWLLFIAATFVVPSLAAHRLLFWIWSIILWQAAINLCWVFIADRRFAWVQWGIFFSAVLRAALILWGVTSPAMIVRAVIITAVLSVMPTIANVLLVRRWIAWRWIDFSWQDTWRLLRVSMPMSVMTLVGPLFMGMDTWFLQIFDGSRAVGYYTVASRPIVFLSLFTYAAFRLLYPVANRLVRDDRRPQKLPVFVQYTLWGLGAWVLPILGGGAILSEEIIQTLFGAAYHVSGPVFALLLVSWALGILREFLSIILVAAGHEAAYARRMVLAGIGNVLLIIGGVRWGPAGVAAALAVTQGGFLLETVRMSRRFVADMPSLSRIVWRLLGVAALAAAMTGIVWLTGRLQWPLGVRIVVGAVSYGAMLWVIPVLPLKAMRRVLHEMQLV